MGCATRVWIARWSSRWWTVPCTIQPQGLCVAGLQYLESPNGRRACGTVRAGESLHVALRGRRLGVGLAAATQGCGARCLQYPSAGGVDLYFGAGNRREIGGCLPSGEDCISSVKKLT